MHKAEKDIHINAPVERVYERWTDFEHFPNIFSHVKEVRKVGDDTYHWVAQVGPQKIEWDAKTTMNVPNKTIGWSSISGDKNSGEVRFEPMGEGTHLYVTILYDPPGGVVGEIADALTHQFPRDLENDLKNFKKSVEANTAHKGQ